MLWSGILKKIQNKRYWIKFFTNNLDYSYRYQFISFSVIYLTQPDILIRNSINDHRNMKINILTKKFGTTWYIFVASFKVKCIEIMAKLSSHLNS